MKKVLAWGLSSHDGRIFGWLFPERGNSRLYGRSGYRGRQRGGQRFSGCRFRRGVYPRDSLHPLSGSSAVSGQILQNATEMAVNEINEAGGINGEIQINLVPVDDEGDPGELRYRYAASGGAGSGAGGHRLPALLLHHGQHGDHPGGKDPADYPRFLQPRRDGERQSFHLSDDGHRRASHAQRHVRTWRRRTEPRPSQSSTSPPTSEPADTASPASCAASLAWRWWPTRFTTPAIRTSPWH